MLEKNKLMNQIMMYDFVLVDLELYLDSHPDCQEGLEQYRKYKKLSSDSRAEYTKNFGPLTQLDSADTDRWTWTDEPWPWERSE